MSKGSDSWQGGRRAWDRLRGWDDDRSTRASPHPDARPSALGALDDVALLRRLLDQVELVAVGTARRHGASWSEIAVRLGVTRQSAWERWRDLDYPVAAAATEISPDAVSVTAPESLTSEQAAKAHRRRSSVVVPNVIGLIWDDARHTLIQRRLVAVGPDPDGPPLAAVGWPNGVVTDQSPESGAKVPPGSPVTVWIGGGGVGSAGVREPRRPRPDPKSAHETL